MFAVVYFSVLACAFAAPQHFRQTNERHTETHSEVEQHDSFKGTTNVIGISGNYNNNMNEIDDMFEQVKNQGFNGSGVLEHFRRPFSLIDPNIQGNQYKIEFDLDGFKQEDITVKVKPGLLKVVADHTENGNKKHFKSTRTLPYFVKPTDGSTEFKNGVLTVTFQLKNRETTQKPDHEESESQENDDED